MANVFLSYDHEDVALARPIAVSLEKAGHTVWYDRHIHGGAQYSRKIEQALDVADAVVVLWSPRSLESAWVRDEAAEGRDSGKLVPLSVEGVTPPMGFRQFQTIDLGEWKGRGKVPHLLDLIEAIRNQAEDEAAPAPAGKGMSHGRIRKSSSRTPILAITGLALLLVAGFAGRTWFERSGPPVVAVQAANGSPSSQAAASDLFVKLGSLAEIGRGKWELVDAASPGLVVDLVFLTADIGSSGSPKASLVLLDGKDDSLLWSREFEFPAGQQADLRQQLSLTAARVLGRALESREAGGLPNNLMKLFLNACALLDEAGNHEPEKVARPLRAVVKARPRFEPAWARLLNVDTKIADMTGHNGGDEKEALRQLRADMEKARAVNADMPALTLADVKFLAPIAYEQRLNLLTKASTQDPDNAEIFAMQNMAMQSVGRMNAALVSARRAADLDPLSPVTSMQVIMTLAYADQLDEARKELAKSERLWAGTGALRDILWGFHLRYGDPAIAKRLAGFSAEDLNAYLAARVDPTAPNIEKLVGRWRGRMTDNTGEIGYTIQALAEFNQTDELVRWLAGVPSDGLANISYLLFRPSFAQFRRDPRFMAVAGRIGLANYWLSTGEWPDYCRQSDLPYDCKTEATKYAS